jgi:hypothetical protein
LLAKVPGKIAAKPGDRLGLAWDQKDCHWFDAKTGERLQ